MSCRWLGCLAIVAACGGARTSTTPRSTLGAIGGLARDRDSGDPVASAQVRLRAQSEFKPLETSSNRQGIYGFDHLAPGKYTLTATFAGQPIEVTSIEVKANETAVVDLTFTLGSVEPTTIEYGDPKQSEIRKYKPKVLSLQLSILEGTVNDLGSKDRVAGAVVTAVAADKQTFQAITDDSGRYRIEAVPGTYAVSAYYSIGGHAQIEVRRSDIAVGGGEAAFVPLWIELAK